MSTLLTECVDKAWRRKGASPVRHSSRSAGLASIEDIICGSIRIYIEPPQALRARRPGTGLVHHTDRGSQYTAATYQATLVAHGVICSMSRSGECLDNAMAERFFDTLKAEVADMRVWPSRAAARRAIFEWIEVWYNRQRRHSTLGYLTPVAHERQVLLLSSRTA